MLCGLKPCHVQATSEADNARLQAALAERAGAGRLRPAGLPALSDFTQDTVALYIAAAERDVTDAGIQQLALCTLCSLVPFGLDDDEAKRRCLLLATAAVPWIIRVLAQHPANAAIAEHGLFLFRRVAWALVDKVCMSCVPPVSVDLGRFGEAIVGRCQMCPARFAVYRCRSWRRCLQPARP